MCLDPVRPGLPGKVNSDGSPHWGQERTHLPLLCTPQNSLAHDKDHRRPSKLDPLMPSLETKLNKPSNSEKT